MHKLGKVATALMTVLAAVHIPAAASADSALTWQDCGNGLRCGQVDVPADWARPGRGERITLGLAMLPAVDQAHKKGTLLVNLGGPAPQLEPFPAAPSDFSRIALCADFPYPSHSLVGRAARRTPRWACVPRSHAALTYTDAVEPAKA
ncbi:hypothetical protein [Nonomuraea sp. NPDC049141]|uniref:hypothetical protein n=1 Tax=unclassified Nonomuraea TaxID=2593643 RepID=UPI0033FDA2EE